MSQEIINLMGDPSTRQEGMTKLYELVKGCYLPYFMGKTEDLMHDVYIDVVKAIDSKRLKNPEALFPFTISVLYRKARKLFKAGFKHMQKNMEYVYIQPGSPAKLTAHTLSWGSAQWDEHSAPTLYIDPTQHDTALHAERVELIRKAFDKLDPLKREILTRFYIKEQPWRQIIEEMNADGIPVTVNSFRLNKWRGKEDLERAVMAGASRSQLLSLAAVR